MKSSEDFYAAVYAKAEVKRAKLRARNRKLRSAAASALTLVLVAAAAFPISKMMRGGPEVLDPSATIKDNYVAPMNTGSSNSRMVVLYDSPEEDAVVVLQDDAQKKEFISQYKAANHLNLDEDLPVTPSDSAITLHSLQELKEYLAALPQNYASLEKAANLYDETFFSENWLYAMPMKFGTETTPAETTAPTTTEVKAETLAEAVAEPDPPPPTVPATTLPPQTTTEPEPTTIPAAFSTVPEETTSAPETTTDPLLSSDVKLLLLVPQSK